MLTLNTNKSFPIRNSTYEIIDNQVIYLTVQKLELDKNNLVAIGFYFYKKVELIENVEIENIVKLKDNRTILSWNAIANVENIALQPMNDVSYQSSNYQRLREFTQIQLQQESGQNFEITFNDWDWNSIL